MKLGTVFESWPFFLVGHPRITSFFKGFSQEHPRHRPLAAVLGLPRDAGSHGGGGPVRSKRQAGQVGAGGVFFGRSGGQEHGWFLGMLRKGGSPKHNVPSLVGNCFQLVLRVSSWWKSRSITIVVVTIDFWNFYGTILAWNEIWRKNIGKNADVCGCGWQNPR